MVDVQMKNAISFPVISLISGRKERNRKQIMQRYIASCFFICLVIILQNGNNKYMPSNIYRYHICAQLLPATTLYAYSLTIHNPACFPFNTTSNSSNTAVNTRMHITTRLIYLENSFLYVIFFSGFNNNAPVTMIKHGTDQSIMLRIIIVHIRWLSVISNDAEPAKAVCNMTTAMQLIARSLVIYAYVV